MRDVNRIELKLNSREEQLPEFHPDFPYTASRALLDQYRVLWHWHKAIEIFYIRSGNLVYSTPAQTMVFPKGSGGLINSGVLHASQPQATSENTIQYLHLFDPSFLSGYAGSRIERKYVAPFAMNSSIEIVPFSPERAEEREILEVLKASFELSEKDFGYELKLRAILSDLWLKIIALPHPQQGAESRQDDKVKMMMAYIAEHFCEKISVSDLAAAAYISERDCYRTFRQILHMTPMDYLTDFRLQQARRMLAEGKETITAVGQSAGFASGSFFGRVFRRKIGCTPMEYRKKWQDSEK